MHDNASTLQIHTSVSGGEGGPVLRLEGDVDVHTCHDLMVSLESMMREGHERISIDLAGVRFIDSSGVQVLLRSKQQRQRARCEVAIVSASQRVRHIFSVLHLDGLLPAPDAPRAPRRRAPAMFEPAF